MKRKIDYQNKKTLSAKQEMRNDFFFLILNISIQIIAIGRVNPLTFSSVSSSFFFTKKVEANMDKSN